MVWLTARTSLETSLLTIRLQAPLAELVLRAELVWLALLAVPPERHGLAEPVLRKM